MREVRWRRDGCLAPVLGLALAMVAAACGSSAPSPGVVVLRDTNGGGPGADAGPGGVDAGRDTGWEARACEADEQCKGAFPDAPECRVERCDDGACVLAAAPDDTPCAQGDRCRFDAVCTGGECVAEALDCDDGNECTEDACAADLGCFYRSVEGACDDHKPWTEGDHCQDGVCVGETGPCTCESDADCAPLDDGDRCDGVPQCRDCVCVPGAPVLCDTSADTECRQTVCEPATGACERRPTAEGEACDDGSGCSADDRCRDGVCSGTPRDCDDQNPCTNDACDAQAGCIHFANMASCDDANACTRNDACVEGYCQGTPRSCDDGDPCTLDSCLPAEGCRNEPASDVHCDDGFDCTEVDVCQDGVCVGTTNTCACETDADCIGQVAADLCRGTLSCEAGACAYDPDAAVVCPAPVPGSCTVQRCVPETGQCAPFALDDGAECEDGTACTAGDQCQGGVCGGAPVDCDDDNPCTDDACDAVAGCTYADNVQPCDDGNPCTVQTACAGGSCGGGQPLSCDDGEACTRDTCSVADGCQHANIAGPCSDGNACTEGDTCDRGVCQPGPPPVCSDQRPCTIDRCDPESGCQFIPNDGAECDDLDPCTPGSVCVGADCVGRGTVDCDDENPCTDDACTPGVGCVHVPNTGAACDDGNTCTEGDVCQHGDCAPGENVCDCETTADCAPLEDGDPCNGTLVCDTKTAPFRCVVDPATVVVCDPAQDTECRRNRCQAATGACALVSVREGQTCEDGDACTAGDVCRSGVCDGGDPPSCHDGEVCTDDTCDPAEGCVFTPNSAACEDGNACTAADVCAGGSCQSGAAVDCDDDDVCTTDRCDVVLGCQYSPSSEPCDDDDACTLDDTCVAGECVGGPPPDCSDGKPCTADACVAPGGCVNPPLDGDCDDGDPCTSGDHCEGGECVGDAVMDCDDGNPCTADVCGGDGCEWVVLPFGTACDDGQDDTVADLCGSTGTCVGWRWAEVSRPGSRATWLTDVAQTRIPGALGSIDLVHVSGRDEVTNNAWTWVGTLETTTLTVGADQFQGDTLTDVSYRLAVGAGGLVVRFDGSRWQTVAPLPDGGAADVGFRAVHGYWTDRDVTNLTVAGETFYLGGVTAAGAPRLWRCHWRLVLLSEVWDCAPASLPAGGAIEHLWATRAPSGDEYVDDRAWAAQLTTDLFTDPGVVLSAAADSDVWTTAPPAGCSAVAGTACQGATWHDLAGPKDQLWAVGAAGRLMRNTGVGWLALTVPSSALWPGTAIEQYTFKAVRVSSARGVHLAGEWTGCADLPCGARVPDVKRLFYLHYDPRADRWDGVRTLLEARCPGVIDPTAGCAQPEWLARYEVAAMEGVEATPPRVIVIGNRPLATADGREDGAGLVFHLTAQ